MGKGNKPSYRHHYIPQFYLSYFKNDAGYLYGYNKETATSFKTYSKDIFYEENRNTFLNDENEESRWIEQVYSKLESEFSVILRKFNQTGQLTVEDRRMYAIHSKFKRFINIPRK
nr:DUF4238 domain-containing protein [uncultured Treponema sp.]